VGQVVRQDERAPFLAALHPRREELLPPGEHVGQEGFLRAGMIRLRCDWRGGGRLRKIAVVAEKRRVEPR
jgi:hypothetical protein